MAVPVEKNVADLSVREARLDDIPELKTLMQASVSTLFRNDYSEVQTQSALKYIFDIDSELIKNRTYFVAESNGILVGSGGWSASGKQFGGDQNDGHELDLSLDDDGTRAKMRAYFVHPDYARLGIGSALLQESEAAATRLGFNRFELFATLTGKTLYSRNGYDIFKYIDFDFPDGTNVRGVLMRKDTHCR